MQAKDIADEDFIDAIRVVHVMREHAHTTAALLFAGVSTGHQVSAFLADIHTALEGLYPGLPRKVLLAKARRVNCKGLADGCACGCNGYFRLPEACKLETAPKKIPDSDDIRARRTERQI